MSEFVSKEDYDALEQRVSRARVVSEETNTMVREMHSALMKPQPGHDKSLLDRMAFVTIQIESGDRVAHWILRIGGLIAAIGALAAVFKYGGSK